MPVGANAVTSKETVRVVEAAGAQLSGYPELARVAKALAEERALENCKATAGGNRRDFCRIEESKCDEK